MEQGKTISIIIPIYNIAPHIEKLTNECVDSIEKHTITQVDQYPIGYKDYELIIVDNKGGEKWKDKADVYIKNNKNVGNGTAWYQGAKKAQGEYLVFSDNDIKVHPGWSGHLLNILKDKNIAVAFPLSKNREDDDYFQRLAGFFWMIRRDVFFEINDNTDKGYRIQDWGVANFEDTSFYMECKKKGYKLICSDQAKVDHYSRATCDSVPEVQKLYEHNEKKYFDKYQILPMLD